MAFYFEKFFNTPIQYLRSVGPAKAESLQKELEIFTYGDLLYHLPFRYIDKSKFNTTQDAYNTDEYVQIKGTITAIKTVGEKKAKRLVATLEDEFGEIELVWFQGLQWIVKKIKLNDEVIAYGKPSKNSRFVNIVHPEVQLQNEAKQDKNYPFEPVYSSTEKLKSKGLDSKGIAKLQYILHQELLRESIVETLILPLLQQYQLVDLKTALLFIHFPSNEYESAQALRRLKFEELFYLQLQILLQKTIVKNSSHGMILKELHHFNVFYNQHLPFALTNAQKRVLKEIRADVISGKQMNRLLQGDVGSGKTIVAFLTMLMAIDNNAQACILAPTEILAQQHFNNLTPMAQAVNLRIELLTGSVKGKARKAIEEGLLQNEIHILVGTHAIFEDNVQFHHLGIAVIDEQHRFGVAQRAKLQEKNKISPHILLMSATPIPRTLAMTLYGDLEVSNIDELPEGRKPIITLHRSDAQRLPVFSFIKNEIELGRQIYIVYPLIEESETLDYKDLMDGYESISRAFPKPTYQVSIVHGRMRSEDKDWEMQRFVRGETQIMIATTVIEVGVNVPNASVMIIENAERFGLSQLHQLRGRVGRGAEQSYCILMTGDKLGNDARTRIKTMCETNDGFKISEVDLQLRGPGDLQGTQQSGVINLKIANLASDQAILMAARNSAIAVLNEDINLNKPENLILKSIIQFKKSNQTNWSRIA